MAGEYPADKGHPREWEIERACSGDGGGSADVPDVSEHLRWCVRCRNVAAEYGWLRRELAAALAMAADAVPVPRSRWWAVRARLFVFAGRRSQGVASWRASVLAGAALTLCLALLASPIAGAAVAQVLAPTASGTWQASATQHQSGGTVVVPMPVTAVASGESMPLGSTPTPVARGVEEMGTAFSPSPMLVPLPTPPQPETLVP